MLIPEWQKLARKMKNNVKIAYWDTAQGNPPRLVGQIRGTPTIKFIYPSPKNKKTASSKSTADTCEEGLDLFICFEIDDLAGEISLPWLLLDATRKCALPNFLH